MLAVPHDYQVPGRLNMKFNKVVCGDCINVLPKIPDEFADMVITSPPYDNLRAYKGYIFNFEPIALQLLRIVKCGGVVIWVVADATNKGSETGTSWKQAQFFNDIGFRIHDTMIYAKNSYMPLTHNRYEQSWEYMFCFSKGKPTYFNPIMVECVTAGTKRYRGNSKADGDKMYAERQRLEHTTVNSHKQHCNIFYYDVGKNEKTDHPAPFPIELVKDQIQTWSDVGSVVIDPFFGSGTVGVACEATNRQFIGIEIVRDYCDIAMSRLDPNHTRLIA